MEKFSTINELIVALLLWITTHTDYKEPKTLPRVHFMEQTDLAELACGRKCEILAFTPEFPKRIIYLSDGLFPMEDRSGNLGSNENTKVGLILSGSLVTCCSACL